LRNLTPHEGEGLLVEIFVLFKPFVIYKELYNDTKINRVGWVVLEILKLNPVGNSTLHEGEGLLVTNFCPP
jgi:hypothetical protein